MLYTLHIFSEKKEILKIWEQPAYHAYAALAAHPHAQHFHPLDKVTAIVNQTKLAVCCNLLHSGLSTLSLIIRLHFLLSITHSQDT